MRTVTATRYVTPLREGGSLPASWRPTTTACMCVKFRGAGQGPRRWSPSWSPASSARALGLPVPELVFVELDPASAAPSRTRDPGAAGASAGPQPRARLPARRAGFDPAVDAALTPTWPPTSSGSTPRHQRRPYRAQHEPAGLARRLWLIDHGAALYFQHRWAARRPRPPPFPQIRTTCCCRSPGPRGGRRAPAPRIERGCSAASPRSSPTPGYRSRESPPAADLGASGRLRGLLCVASRAAAVH